MGQNPGFTGCSGVSEQISWSRKSLEELEQFYHDEIEPAWHRAGNDPVHDQPPYLWLAGNGYSGLNYALREHRDMTVKEFFVDVLNFPEDPDSEGYTWEIDAKDTVAELDKYVRTLSRRRKLADSTVETKRARLAKYVRIYADVHGAAPIVKRVCDRDEQPDEIERALAMFDELDVELDSDDSKLRYYGDVSQFYEHLQRRGVAAYNPVSNFDKEYGWERSEPDNPALNPRQGRTLYEQADAADELLVLALCAWGLQPNDVAALHTSQFVLDGNDPHIAFDEQKTARGRWRCCTVARHSRIDGSISVITRTGTGICSRRRPRRMATSSRIRWAIGSHHSPSVLASLSAGRRRRPRWGAGSGTPRTPMLSAPSSSSLTGSPPIRGAATRRSSQVTISVRTPTRTPPGVHARTPRGRV